MDFYKALLYNCTERTNGSMALNDPPLSSPIMRTVLFIFSIFFFGATRCLWFEASNHITLNGADTWDIRDSSLLERATSNGQKEGRRNAFTYWIISIFVTLDGKMLQGLQNCVGMCNRPVA